MNMAFCRVSAAWGLGLLELGRGRVEGLSLSRAHVGLGCTRL